MIFKYELRFVAFVNMAEYLLVRPNFVSGICKLKPKKLKNYFFVKKLGFYRPCSEPPMSKSYDKQREMQSGAAHVSAERRRQKTW